MWPSLIAASAVEVNILVNGQFASGIDGARSWLSLAFRVLYFPIGMFGVAIATVLLPSVARYESNHDRLSFGRQVEEALRLSLFLSVPAAAGLFALAPDILAPIYQRGAFTTEATLQTAAALRAYAFGLAGYAVIKVLVPCFHALGKPRLPLRVNLIAIGLNLGLNALLVLVCKLGHVGIAASMAGVSILNGAQLILLLRRDVPLGSAVRWSRMGAVVLAGALLCGAGAWEAVRLLKHLWPQSSLLVQAARVLAAAGTGALLYAAFTAACGLAETRLAVSIIRNKLVRKG
jgi:putative peptidoglycan lipid II flippase